MAAFANCQKTDGGEECIQDILAGLDCMSKKEHQGVNRIVYGGGGRLSSRFRSAIFM